MPWLCINLTRCFSLLLGLHLSYYCTEGYDLAPVNLHLDPWTTCGFPQLPIVFWIPYLGSHCFLCLKCPHPLPFLGIEANTYSSFKNTVKASPLLWSYLWRPPAIPLIIPFISHLYLVGDFLSWQIRIHRVPSLKRFTIIIQPEISLYNLDM